MHINRDELMLLTLRGRLPPSAGPPRALLAPAAESHRHRAGAGAGAGWSWRVPSRLRLMSTGLRRGRRAGDPVGRPAGACAPPAAEARRSVPAGGYADRATYMELEFAVGFAAEDEPWL